MAETVGTPDVPGERPIGLIERLIRMRRAKEAGDPTGGATIPRGPNAERIRQEIAPTNNEQEQIKNEISMLEKFLRRFRGQSQIDNPERSK